MFTSEMPSLESISVIWVFLIVFGLIQLVIGVWSIFISLKSFSEAQSFLRGVH